MRKKTSSLVKPRVSHTKLTPDASESEDSLDVVVSSSDDENHKNLKVDQSYKDASYWKLPENVRHAIDLSKNKSNHTDFSMKLSALNDKITVYKKLFYTNTPKFVEKFNDKKRLMLEETMKKKT